MAGDPSTISMSQPPRHPQGPRRRSAAAVFTKPLSAVAKQIRMARALPYSGGSKGQEVGLGKSSNGPEKAVTVVKQSGKWIVTVRVDDSTVHSAFASEDEARRYEAYHRDRLGLK